jgi:hypothetical protein
MQSENIRRVLALLAAGFAFILIGACSREADNPYARLKDPPLLRAELHTVTLVTDGTAVAEQLRDQGYVPIAFSSNYPASVPVEAMLWNVPEPVAARSLEFKAPTVQVPNLRLLVMPLAARGLVADSSIQAAFFRNVLGVDVPHWPASGRLPANVRVQVWTYLIPNVLEASRRLRASGVPVIFDPVGITTAYLGDHKTMAIRAPDGTVVELVETAAR